MKKIPQDIVGTIAILKFPKKMWQITKKLKSRKFLKENKNIKTVVEKTKGFSGKLRIPKTKYLSGEKTTITNYNENNSNFTYDINKTYFSPRLSEERKKTAEEIISIIKKGQIKNPKILTLFSGVGPYPIVIAKKLKQEKLKGNIYANELNNDANKFAEKNILKNKVQKYITLIPGDAKNISKEISIKLDIIIMTRPNIKETFLKSILPITKKGTIVFYHGFGTKEEVLNEINSDIAKKIKNIKIRKAGDIGAYKFRWQVTFEIK
jgi:tRNA (guanine37-N1)-methyltransferase